MTNLLGDLPHDRPLQHYILNKGNRNKLTFSSPSLFPTWIQRKHIASNSLYIGGRSFPVKPELQTCLHVTLQPEFTSTVWLKEEFKVILNCSGPENIRWNTDERSKPKSFFQEPVFNLRPQRTSTQILLKVVLPAVKKIINNLKKYHE